MYSCRSMQLCNPWLNDEKAGPPLEWVGGSAGMCAVLLWDVGPTL